jgi:hypothetical protein
MRLYGAIQKVEPQDDGTVRVHGIATSEAVDDQGEIVRAEAMRAAIPDYMCFPALREMHQLSAAGTTLEAEVWEDGTTRIVAHVIDPVAVAKVKNRVYRGFSIGLPRYSARSRQSEGDHGPSPRRNLFGRSPSEPRSNIRLLEGRNREGGFCYCNRPCWSE